MARSDNRVHALGIGAHTIRLVTPDRGVHEEGSRISLWWGVTSAAVALAEHLVAQGELRGERVVELGCGVGLAGIAAGLAGAHVTFTDLVQDALAHARDNARRNGLDGARTAFVPLDWETPGECGRFDRVVGAEIAYDYFVHDALLRVFDRLCAPQGEILLADRRRLVVDRLVGRLYGLGWEVDGAATAVDRDGLPRQEITVWRITRGG